MLMISYNSASLYLYYILDIVTHSAYFPFLHGFVVLLEVTKTLLGEGGLLEYAHLRKTVIVLFKGGKLLL